MPSACSLCDSSPRSGCACWMCSRTWVACCSCASRSCCSRSCRACAVIAACIRAWMSSTCCGLEESLVGRRDLHCKQMPERIHCHMHLAAFLPLIAVVTGARAALTGGLQCPPVVNDGAGLALLPLGDTQDGTQVTDNGFKAARLQPALRLLVKRFPWREVVGEQAPRRSSTRHPAQRIEHRPQCVLAVRSLLRHQAQVRRRKRPLFVGNVGRIWAFALHPTTIAASPKSS
ncbi:hypothetical protein XTPLMG728_2779 [Xanthomonas translucens pv. poae]|uniref:Uncharacterized protein n=1 Tax=Xanthomonas graminis pv. poae TaxID=227946 RepID=A0A0K3A3P0_9XANT|nr:hypothetical protein XTPLMG728_2779 [Xanthomonas translucens pv. poae]